MSLLFTGAEARGDDPDHQHQEALREGAGAGIGPTTNYCMVSRTMYAPAATTGEFCA